MSNFNVQTQQNSVDVVLTRDISRQVVNQAVANNITPGAVSPLIVTGTGGALADIQLRQFARQIVLVNAGGITANATLTVGADTAANAARLQRVLSIPQVNDTVMLQMNTFGTTAAFTIALGNSSGTLLNVRFAVGGGASAASAVFAAASSIQNNGLILIMATNLVATPGAEVILFQVIRAATA